MKSGNDFMYFVSNCFNSFVYRPPFFNQKLKPEIKELHDNSKKEIELVIELLDQELNLCLK
jgi:hypothetical protein